MGRLAYKLTEKDSLDYSREANEIIFEIPDGLKIQEFKVVCMRMASAMGYSDKSIKNSFGSIDETSHNVDDLIKILHER